MLIWTGGGWGDSGEVVHKPMATDERERFYRAVARTGPRRIKPVNVPDWSAALGLVGLVLMAGLVAGGVFFWVAVIQKWLAR